MNIKLKNVEPPCKHCFIFFIQRYDMVFNQNADIIKWQFYSLKYVYKVKDTEISCI